MALDLEVEKAITQAVTELDQPKQLEKRLIAWLTDLSDRELTAEEENQHLEFARAAVRTPETPS